MSGAPIHRPGVGPGEDAQSAGRAEPRLPLLMSWPYIVPEVQRAMCDHAKDIDLFVDCGAVTAQASGKVLKLDRYIEFLKKLPVTPFAYMALDVIGDPKLTKLNYEVMLEAGLKPVPVFTRNQPFEAIDELFKTAHLVAVGGMAVRGSRAVGHMAGALKVANGRPVHLLGMTSIPMLKVTKPFSADSSSWESAARYGSIVLYMGQAKMMKLDRDAFRKRPEDRILERIKLLGGDPYALLKEERWRGGSSETRFISAASWCALSRDLEKHVGTKLFLAAANKQAMMALVRAHVWQTRRERV